MQCKICHGISEIDTDASFMQRGVCVDCEDEFRARLAGALCEWEVA